MEIVLGKITGRNGNRARGRDISLRQRSMGEDARCPCIRILRKFVAGYHAARRAIFGRGASTACCEGTDRQLRNGQVVHLQKRQAEIRSPIGDEDSDGHDEAVFILPVENCSTKTCSTQGPVEIEYVRPSGVRQITHH